MMDWDDRTPLLHREANDLYFGADCDEWPLDSELPLPDETETPFDD